MQREVKLFDELSDNELIAKKNQAWDRYRRSQAVYDGELMSSRMLYIFRQLESEYKRRKGQK